MARSRKRSSLAQPPERLNLAFVLTVAVLFAASFFPEARLWGFSDYGYFGWPGRIVLLLAAALVWLLTQRSGGGSKSRTRVSWPVVSIAIIVGSGLLFYLLHQRTHFLGDGVQLLARLAEAGPPKPFWGPAAYWIQDNLFALLGESGLDGSRRVFQIISIGSGAAITGMICWAAPRLYEDFNDRMFFVLGLATGNYALMFYGYVENYSTFVALMLAFGLLGLLHLRGRLACWPAIIPFLIAGLFHPFTVGMAPAAVYLLLQGTATGRWFAERGRRLWIGAGTLGLLVVVAVFWHYYTTEWFFRFALVPIFEDHLTVEGYTLLSAKHLLDYLSLTFQSHPGLPILVAALIGLPLSWIISKPEYRFLLLFLIPYLVIAFLFDPKLGMGRDWDVFGLGGIALALLVYVVLLDLRRSEARYRSTVLMAFALAAMVFGPRVLIQADESRGLELMDNLCRLDPIRNRKGETLMLMHMINIGRRAEVEARVAGQPRGYPERVKFDQGMAMGDRGRYREAIARMNEALEINPAYYPAWCFKGRAYAELGKYDSALAILALAEGLNPRNPTIYNNYGIVYWLQDDLDEAEQWWLRSRESYSNNREALEWLVKLYHKQGKRGRYLTVLRELMTYPDASFDAVALMAQEYIFVNQYDSARAVLKAGLSRGMDSTFVRNLQEQHPELRVF